VEEVLACLATLVGHFLIRRYDRVADGTLCLPPESSDHVFAEYAEAIGYRAVLEMC
jgi:hypothetical protein